VSDGLIYLEGQYLQPLLAQPQAPAVADLGAQALRAAYFAQQHQATLIGSQTYPMRLLSRREPVMLEVNSYQRVAEWCSVHLAPHHKRIEVEAMVAYAGAAPTRMYLRTVVFDGTATHTSTATSELLAVDQLVGVSSGRAIATIQNMLDLPATNLPVSTAQVRVEAYAVLESTTTALPVAPLVISAWRTSP
jgi:hypothetical protein